MAITIDVKLKTFLSLISWSEGTSIAPLTKNLGYDVIVTGIHGPSVFTDYTDHPFAHGGSVQFHLNPPEFSTAAGRYQVLAHYFEAYKAQLGLPDFSPASQDRVAIQQISERNSIHLIEQGNIAGAITACSNIWASFPGNDYGQGGHSLAGLVAKYTADLAALGG
jgi:muramidase (phage lysozyme)